MYLDCRQEKAFTCVCRQFTLPNAVEITVWTVIGVHRTCVQNLEKSQGTLGLPVNLPGKHRNVEQEEDVVEADKHGNGGDRMSNDFDQNPLVQPAKKPPKSYLWFHLSAWKRISGITNNKRIDLSVSGKQKCRCTQICTHLELHCVALM